MAKPSKRASPGISRHAALLFQDATCKPTEDHVEGPYYRPGAPPLTDLYPADSHGPVLHFEGSVTDTQCKPVHGVTGEIWQADELGRYDNDDPAHPPAPNYFRCRAKFAISPDGSFRLRTVLPANYTVDDTDGPWTRVKHLHFKFYAHGHQPFTTEIELLPDDYRKDDKLYNPHLAVHLQSAGEENGRPAFRAHFAFVLKPVSKKGYALAAARLKRPK
jgi:catechol 1,2-dioxygenase